MDRFDVILFDLDGTLTDSAPGIINSVVYSLKKFGIEVEDRTPLRKFIGPPLVDSYMIFYGFDKEKALQAVKYYREYFTDKGIFENSVYEGIPETLAKLKSAGKKLVLATSKPQAFAERILEHFNIMEFFDLVVGATMDEKRTKKKDVIAYILELLNFSRTERIVMVGDRDQDILGAKDNNLQSIGVLFGFGDYEELKNAGAGFLADTPQNIADIILDV